MSGRLVQPIAQGALQMLRRFVPAAQSSADTKLFEQVLRDADKRSGALSAQLQRALFKTPSGVSPKIQALEKQALPLSIARDNLTSARYAAKDKGKVLGPEYSEFSGLDFTTPTRNEYDDMRLLLATTPDARRHAASALYYTPGYKTGRGIPENGVYLEGLSSEVPGGGTQALRAIREQYPNNPIFLESLRVPETEAFYAKRGFRKADPGTSEINNMFVLPYGAQLKKKGGLARMKECRCHG